MVKIKYGQFQGRDQAERDKWVKALERAIHEKSGYYKPQQEDKVLELSTKVSHAEKQLQDLIEQVRNFEKLKENEEETQKRKKLLNEVLQSSKRLQSTVDHSIIILRQVQRHFIESADGKKEIKEEEEQLEVSSFLVILGCSLDFIIVR